MEVENDTPQIPKNKFHKELSFTDVNDAEVYKVITKRGNSYMVKEENILNISPEFTDSLEKMIDDLINAAKENSFKSARKAYWLKKLSVFTTILIIIFGVAVAILNIDSDIKTTATYIATVLGFLISGLETFSKTFSPEKKGIILKKLSKQFEDISRQGVFVKTNPKKKNYYELKNKLEKLYEKMSELEITKFNQNNIISRRTETKFLTDIKRDTNKITNKTDI